MRTKKPTCRECACHKVCDYFANENDHRLDEPCALSYWQSSFVPMPCDIAREVLQEFITVLRKNYVTVPILKKPLDEIAKEIEQKYTESGDNK